MRSETVTVTVCSESITCTGSGTTVSATGSGTAFCGVLAISPPKCLSKENRFEVNHIGVGQMLVGLQDPQCIQQLLKTVQPEGVVEGLFVEVIEVVEKV